MKLSTPNPAASPYLAIYVWGKELGSYNYFILDEQQRAKDDGAPLDAIYKDETTGHWHTVSELSPNHPFRESMKQQQPHQ
jgi:hypothetical protein